MCIRDRVSTLLPVFDAERCTGCKKCVQFCRFHALMYIKEKPMVFSEVCHSCGGCSLVCPENAITEREKPVGILEIGTAKNVRVVTGILNPGEASGIPIIREALKQADGFTVLACPPGSACSVMECVMAVSYTHLFRENSTGILWCPYGTFIRSSRSLVRKEPQCDDKGYR